MARRITVEEVLEAYRVTGMRPIIHSVLDDSCDCISGCAAGALAIANGVRKDTEEIYKWCDVSFEDSYIGGFYAGFDGDEIYEHADDSVKLGYADGTAVREAVFTKGAK